MWTKQEAENRARNLTALDGKPWIVFRIPENTAATAWALTRKLSAAYRYANCEESEREYYREHGATFPDEE